MSSRASRTGTLPVRTSPLPPSAPSHLLRGMIIDNRTFRFRKPIRVEEFQEHGLWMHEYKPLGGPGLWAHARAILDVVPG